MTNKKYIITRDVVEKKIRRMALEVTERNYNETDLVLIGIKDNGVVIAGKIASFLKENFKGNIELVELDLDKTHPEEVKLNKEVDVNNKAVVLIDDVVNSGKALVYALKPLLEQHPKKIQTLVLVARTHKAFPVAVDFVGQSFSTSLDEHIYVESENNEITGAYIL